MSPLEALYLALSSPRGLVFRAVGCSVAQAVPKILKVKGEQSVRDPDLRGLVVAPSPVVGDEVWIKHKKPPAEGDDPQAQELTDDL